jgi:peptide/nickel transport system permease protein
MRQPHSVAGVLIVLVFLGLAVAGPAIAPYSDNDQSHPVAQSPGPGYPFGTDYLGRDVYSRILLGARSIILTAGVGTLIAVLLGTLLGLFIGYYGGLIDEIAGRVIDAILALPALLIALITVGMIRTLDLPAGSVRAAMADRSVLLVIAIVYIPIVARVVRSSTLNVKNSEFIWAAQIRGDSPLDTHVSRSCPL